MEAKGTQSRKPQTIYGWCPWCGREIEKGETAVAVWIQQEREAPENTPIPEVDVLNTDGVIALCRDCGDKLDGEELRALIHDRYKENINAGDDGWSLPETRRQAQLDHHAREAATGLTAAEIRYLASTLLADAGYLEQGECS